MLSFLFDFHIWGWSAWSKNRGRNTSSCTELSGILAIPPGLPKSQMERTWANIKGPKMLCEWNPIHRRSLDWLFWIFFLAPRLQPMTIRPLSAFDNLSAVFKTDAQVGQSESLGAVGSSCLEVRISCLMLHSFGNLRPKFPHILAWWKCHEEPI